MPGNFFVVLRNLCRLHGKWFYAQFPTVIRTTDVNLLNSETLFFTIGVQHLLQ